MLASGYRMNPTTVAACTVQWLVLIVIANGANAALHAQTTHTSPVAPGRLTLETGKEIYQAGCIACHGADGSGQLQELAGFERPETFPDFTDCPSSTAESDVQWRAIITNGGLARAFSEIMPAFKDVLTQKQISSVIEYVRGFCRDEAWPRGNLNLPRPIVTEKAFPENETVIEMSVNTRGNPGVGSKVVYERRIGATAMIEAVVPYEFTNDGSDWGAAFGDLALGYKQKLFHSLKKGSIVSIGGEVAVPSGNATLGTGGESTAFEAFAALGQLLPAGAFLQVQTGIELPVHPDKVPRAYFLRTAVGKMFAQEASLGRRWSPMVELVADRDLVSGGTTNWDVVPEIQIPISKRMHILGSVGVRLPINNTTDRQRQVMFYVLWEWVDGGLKDGW
jgi:mono/diheme cytochrome c family protein